MTLAATAPTRKRRVQPNAILGTLPMILVSIVLALFFGVLVKQALFG